MHRRSFLMNLAGATIAGSGSVQAQKGKKVFLNYTQSELARAYNQWNWAPNADERLEEIIARSALVRRAYPPQLFKYGPSDDETLDVFASGGIKGAPILIYIHGGGWRKLDREKSAGEAPTFVDRGVVYIVLNFSLIPKVRIPTMVEQIQRAIAWVHSKAVTIGGDPDRISIWGASSGAHLAGVMLAADWKQFNLQRTPIRGALTISGVYDLHPLILSGARNYVQLSTEEVIALSPQLHVERIRSPTIVCYGENESPEFKRQGDEFAAALAKHNYLTEKIVLPNTNHFETIEYLHNPNSPLTQAVLSQMGLPSSISGSRAPVVK